MKVEPYLVEESNISCAWAKVMLHIMSPGIDEISPLMVKVDLSNGQLQEVAKIRHLADTALADFERQPCETTANTIFPTSLWIPDAGRQQLYDRYLGMLPRLKRHRLNRFGLYFERLIAYGAEKVNQLEHILETWERGNHRRSELQATIVDPNQDQSHAPMRGFPCLQQITFAPGKAGLTVIGYYGVQYIFDRAYGNYLGLCRLGQFMAHEMELPFAGLVCVSGIAHRGKPNKAQLEGFKKALEDLVQAEAVIRRNGTVENGQAVIVKEKIVRKLTV